MARLSRRAGILPASEPRHFYGRQDACPTSPTPLAAWREPSGPERLLRYLRHRRTARAGSRRAATSSRRVGILPASET